MSTFHFRRTTRRHFLDQVRGLALGTAAVGLGLSPAHVRAAEGDDSASPKPDAALSKVLLETSSFVYISPLLASGRESTCHAELWYGWIDDSVVVIVSSDRWKAKAVSRGLDRARVWVGNHGVWKGWLGSRNEAFRKAPHFDAKVERIDDPTMIDRLLAIYDVKYPEEIASWREPMRSGAADGSRVLLRYKMPS